MELYKSKYLTITLTAYIHRAVEVAKAAKRPLLILTTDPIYGNMPIDKVYRNVLARPCPCGGLDTKNSCICTDNEILLHRRQLNENFKNSLVVAGYFSWRRDVKLEHFKDDGGMLLKQAVEEFKLSMSAIIVIVDAAAAIAKLDDSDDIAPEHIAEAISYRLPAN